MDGIPALSCFQLVRCPHKNPRGMTGKDMFVELVVHHEFPGTKVIKQNCWLLEDKIVCVAVRCVVEPFDTDDRWMVVFPDSQQRTRLVPMYSMVPLELID
jgi:hypothetical protein